MKILLLTTALLISVTTFAKVAYYNDLTSDILTLNNQMTFTGKIKKIKGCNVVFKADGKKYTVPITDVYSMQFANVEDQVYLDYLNHLENDAEACKKGDKDAMLYHGKENMHIALGFLFGPFALLGTALTEVTPERGNDTEILSENKELFNDPAYLRCYEKRAKRTLYGKELIGWGASVAISLVANIILLGLQ